MRKIFTLAAAVLASVSMWANPYYIISGKCNVPLTAGMNSAKYQILKVDGETVEATEEISSSITATASFYYNSTSVALADLTTASNYGSSSSSSRTMQSVKLQQNEEMKITLNDKVIEELDVIYFCGSKDPCSLTIEGEEQSTSDQDVHVYSKSDSFSDTITIKNTSTKAKEYRIFVILTISDAAPSTDPVATVTLNGPAEGFVGKEVSFSVTTDVKANAYKWYVDGAEQEGATAAKFNFTPEAERTYRILAAAKNDYNSDFVQSEGLDFVATVKPAAVPCAELYPATAGDTPAEGAKAALTDASYGGNIIFAGAKDDNKDGIPDYDLSFQYNELGLQMCKGGADSVRVELGFNLAVGSKIKLHITVGTMCDTKERGFNLLAPGQKKVMGAVWQPKKTAEATDSIVSKVFEYEVTASDGMAGQNKFGLQRSNSAILQAIIVSDCGEEIVPDTDPVVEAVVAGPAEAFVGQTVQLTCTAAKADKFQWHDANGAIEGATTAKYSFTPEAAGAYSFYCLASNDYTATPVQSNTLVINVTEQVLLEQVDVTGDIVWDWENAATVNEIQFDNSTTPKKNERVLLANVDGMNNNETFNSQALLFEGEFAMRIQSGMKLCQGQLLQFHTTVDGYLSVTYSNTGGRDAAEGEIEGQESERRFLTLNGALVDGDKGSMVSKSTTLTANIPVTAGDVAIGGRRPFRTDGKDAATAEYLRFFKVQFSTTPIDDVPEGLEEIDASAKAVKIMHNGQLLIKKGDVFYNAQGARLF